jgi:S1-C subfamily serine protease
MTQPSSDRKTLPLVLSAFMLGMLVMFAIMRLVPSEPSRNGPSISIVAASPLPTMMQAAESAVPDATQVAAAAPASGDLPGQLTPQQIADKAKPAVVYIECQSISGETKSQGSGFCVGPEMVVTNYHVIQNARSIGVRVVSSQSELDNAVLVKVDSEHDLALLRIAGMNAPVLAIQSAWPSVGDPIFTMTNPRGLEGTFTEGNVSAYRKTERFVDPLMQISAPISPGSSGGPVLDRYGQVVGVVVATFKDAQNINFAVPAKHVEALLSSATSPTVPSARPEVSSTLQVTLTPQELYYKGLEDLDSGNRAGALEIWNQLQRLDKGLADRLFDAYRKSVQGN